MSQLHRNDLLMACSNALRLTVPAEAPPMLIHHVGRALSLADRHCREGQKKGRKKGQKR